MGGLNLRQGLIIVMVVVSMMLASLSHAQESLSSESTKIPQSQGLRPVKGFKFELQSHNYFRSSEPYYRDQAESLQNELSVGVNAEWLKGNRRLQLNVRDDYRPGEGWHYIKPIEGFVQWSGKLAEVSLGRKLESWSEADVLWGQGLWQSRFLDDRIRREQAGFIGLFVEKTWGSQNFLVHLSPMFIPDMGPQARVVDGQVVSANPWFKTPPTQAMLNGVMTDLLYSLNQPDTFEIISRSSYAARYQVKGEKGYFARVSGARKPMNHLFFGAPINLNVGTPTYASIDLHVRVLEHEVYTFELGRTKVGGWNYWVSGTRERPIRDVTPSSWTTQEASSAEITSGYVGRDLNDSGSDQIFMSFTNVSGGDAPDRGDVTAETSLFGRRFMFLRAYQLGVQFSSRLRRSWKASEIHASVTYDDLQQGVLSSIRLSQPFAKSWNFMASADLIGLLTLNAPVANGFLSDYRANDRLSVGVSYVF